MSYSSPISEDMSEGYAVDISPKTTPCRSKSGAAKRWSQHLPLSMSFSTMHDHMVQEFPITCRASVKTLKAPSMTIAGFMSPSVPRTPVHTGFSWGSVFFSWSHKVFFLFGLGRL
ncbi:hypothetical protein AC1031_004338 [Aphanomyces cochlioides]|nr:hypothetical protein AC1031_004338 [Aphanomyces cochlioides]